MKDERLQKLQKELADLQKEWQNLGQELSQKPLLQTIDWVLIGSYIGLLVVYGYSGLLRWLFIAIFVFAVGCIRLLRHHTWERHPKVIDFEARRQALQRDIDALRDSKETDLA